ncbi:MAG: hypothetical protein FJ135_02020 [Deltaproteobacteria bacterium]|nr:hypothetical protein [Deltaproteobacteria bacterium]
MTVRFIRLELREVKIPFRFSFKHALATRREADNLILALHTDTGHVGYGEVIPREYLTGETVDSAWQDLMAQYWPAIKDLDLTPEKLPLEQLQPVFAWATEHRKTSAYAGIDLAVWDAWARVSGRPGKSLFGQPRPPGAVAITGPLGAGSLRQMWRTASLMKWVGYGQFKLKVGGVQDLAAVRLLRRIIGSRRDLRVDANGGWEETQAIAMAQELRQFEVSSVEQPIPAGDVAALARVQREGGLPVMADESLCTLADAQDLLAEKAAAIWNLRLAKIGGFTGFLAMLQVAGYPLPPTLHLDIPGQEQQISDHRPKIQLGVLVGETSILTAAARACWGLCPYVHVEYGFPRILLKIDPFTGDPGGYSGTGHPLGEEFGLGVSPRRYHLHKVTVRRQVLD